jgi:hypothetical protein
VIPASACVATRPLSLCRRRAAADDAATFDNALLSAAFMSSNARHPTPPFRRDTRAWQLQVWISFAVAAALCAIGLCWLPGQDIDRAFMVMGYGFCLSTAFVLSKSIRDNHQRKVDTPLWGTRCARGRCARSALRRGA